MSGPIFNVFRDSELVEARGTPPPLQPTTLTDTHFARKDFGDRKARRREVLRRGLEKRWAYTGPGRQWKVLLEIQARKIMDASGEFGGGSMSEKEFTERRARHLDEAAEALREKWKARGLWRPAWEADGAPHGDWDMPWGDRNHGPGYRSRSLHQFLYEVEERQHERSILPAREGSGRASFPGQNTDAYRAAKADWEYRMIWDKSWGVLPGDLWRHEVSRALWLAHEVPAWEAEDEDMVGRGQGELWDEETPLRLRSPKEFSWEVISLSGKLDDAENHSMVASPSPCTHGRRATGAMPQTLTPMIQRQRGSPNLRRLLHQRKLLQQEQQRREQDQAQQESTQKQQPKPKPKPKQQEPDQQEFELEKKQKPEQEQQAPDQEQQNPQRKKRKATPPSKAESPATNYPVAPKAPRLRRSTRIREASKRDAEEPSKNPHAKRARKQ
ncbi:hypothetical protein N3K66_000453 [Trichothecium roseum]|uniref:Uncharacterized protein n=1 Tax=Trichothecium roseum TaxID=47278 RepID=A0ACC0VBZ8_9HYPO|nr:hypothetical protein N3K66_000453 [Trichothecium roseum]